MKLTDNVGIGRIMECSGASSIVNNCFSWLRKGGIILLVGLPKEPLHVQNVLPDVIFKSLTLKTIHGRKIFHTWVEAEKLVSERLGNGKRKMDLTPLITSVVPLS